MTQTLAPVTRREVAGAVRPAFAAGSVGPAQLIDAARAAAARPEVLDLLQRLPARRFGELRDLWEQWPDMPVSV